jgi:3-phosphoshikimate 1-carboxyvinyltransferase
VDKVFNKPTVKGEIYAVASKSEAHRALICAALADGTTRVECHETNDDIDATVSCLCALGAKIHRDASGFFVQPINRVNGGAALECNESGSTLRFLLPVAAALGADCSFYMRGRLPQRPLSPLYELLSDNGISLGKMGQSPLCISGKLSAGNYSIAANVSSQYISGLLMALSICHGTSKLALTGKIESAPYIDMTVDALTHFGASIEFNTDNNTFYIDGKSRLTSPTVASVGGDWSGGAFFLCAGAIGKSSVTVRGLDVGSRQGDKKILSVLEAMGARTEVGDGAITVYPSKIHGTNIDAAQIPDLVPILATVASVAEGKTVIYNASRLRLKESDRIQSTCDFLARLGANIAPTDDGMIISGKSALVGGVVDSFGDHRIAMSAAIASLVCTEKVTVRGFEATAKSYPSFAENFN